MYFSTSCCYHTASQLDVPTRNHFRSICRLTWVIQAIVRGELNREGKQFNVDDALKMNLSYNILVKESICTLS